MDMTGYTLIQPEQLSDNVVDMISRQWMLITAGNADSFNTMTASWGAIGFVWKHPAAFILVRESRYTFQFLQREQAFTLSVFDERYRHALNVCGTKSGRDTDKVLEAGLTPMPLPSGMMAFSEARLVIECRTMFEQLMDTRHFTPMFKQDVLASCYAKDAANHHLFVGYITNVYVKQS